MNNSNRRRGAVSGHFSRRNVRPIGTIEEASQHSIRRPGYHLEFVRDRIAESQDAPYFDEASA